PVIRFNVSRRWSRTDRSIGCAGRPVAARIEGRRCRKAIAMSGDDATSSQSGTPEATIGLLQAASRLGIGRNKAYELARSGRFPVPLLPVGRRLRVPVALLQAFVDGQVVFA